MLNTMLLTADKAVSTMLRLLAVILVSFALTLPEATQDLNLATNELERHANANIIAGYNLNIKKSLDNADNTKTNLIINAGILHANNNIILATTLSNTKGDITASKDLNITSNDITTTEGKISANNTNITTNNLDSTDTNILAVNNLNGSLVARFKSCVASILPVLVALVVTPILTSLAMMLAWLSSSLVLSVNKLSA
jgi:uncharacterized protein (UPF0333 family)